jgi:glycosyltransferase involved in cell wall biosynthesis
MKISVILPCFNGASTIALQLDALCRQSWAGDWEVIVSNNGSTDESMAIVAQYRHRLPDLQIVEAYQPPAPHLGACHTYNQAFKVASGDAFVLCEADDEVGEGWLEAMANALLEHEFVAARMNYHKLNSSWVVQPRGRKQALQEVDLPRLGCYPFYQYAWGCTFGFRRSVYETLGEFNMDFSCVFDAEYCWKAQAAGLDIHFVEDAIIYYRLRSSLDALLKQRQNWGEEFTLLMRCYNAPSGKLMALRTRLTLLWLTTLRLALTLATVLKLPNSRKYLYQTVADLGWNLGAMKGRTRPLPPSYA